MRIAGLWLLAGVMAWGQEAPKEEAKEPAKEEEKQPAKEPEKEAPAACEELVITAERIETERRLSGGVYGLVTAEELQIRNHGDIQEAIRLTPGVHVVQTAGKGGLTSLFIRGGESDHALFLVDGVKVNADGGGIDLAPFTSDGAGRLEIVRGATSTSWGADSMSGALSIVTKRGEGPPTVRASVEGGNLAAMRERLSFETGDEDYGLLLALSRFDEWGGRWKHSDYHNTSVAARFDWALADATELKATVRYADETAEQFAVDPGPRFVDEDENGEKRGDNLVLGLEVSQRILDDWTLTLRGGRFDQDVRFSNLGPGEYDSISKFARTQVGLQSDAAIFDQDDFRYVFTLGAEWEREDLTSSDTFSAGLGTNERRQDRAAWMQHRFEAWSRLGVTLSGRFDRSTAFGSAWTGRAALTYDLKETGTRPHASIANGIKTPTMTESFSSNPFYPGNPDLHPEKSETFDIGIEQRIWEDRIRADVTYFSNRMKDLVAYTGGDPAFHNAGNARARGWEFSLEARPLDWLRISGGWTWQHTRVLSARVESDAFQEGQDLIRRPNNSGFLEVGVKWSYEEDVPVRQRGEHPRIGASLRAFYVGNRDDVIFWSFPDVPERVRNRDYVRLDLSAEWWPIDRTLRVFASVDNLTDTRYEEVVGYPNERINFMAGAEVMFEVPKLKRKQK